MYPQSNRTEPITQRLAADWSESGRVSISLSDQWNSFYNWTITRMKSTNFSLILSSFHIKNWNFFFLFFFILFFWISSLWNLLFDYRPNYLCTWESNDRVEQSEQRQCGPEPVLAVINFWFIKIDWCHVQCVFYFHFFVFFFRFPTSHCTQFGR